MPYFVRFSPDGKRLALLSDRVAACIQVWDWQTRSVLYTSTFLDAVPFLLSFSPDGKFLAVGRARGIVSLINVSAGQEFKTLTLGV
jgi:WD40 repeat protein